MSERRSYRWRLYVVVMLLAMAVVGLVGRLIYLNVIDRDFLLKQSKARILRTEVMPAFRGMILDRHGYPLAISTPLDSIWVNPQLYKADESQNQAVASLLGINFGRMEARIRAAREHRREFTYLKRLNSPQIASEIKRLKIPGMYIQREYKRFYPQGEVASHVVGLTNVDDRGQEGLELSFNQWLAGTPGKKEVIKDRLGHTIADVALLKKPEQGQNLVLSLDHRIQYLAYRTLKAQVEKFHAASGSVLVLNVKTGEILADVNQPSYNPNDRPKVHDGRFRNRALTDIFEPGSTIKPFTIALALQSGEYHPGSEINTSPGWIRVGGYTIKDDGLDYGTIDLTQVLKKSSNVGAAKIMLSLSANQYWQLLRKLGFGQRSSSGFPGEARGRLVERSTWYPSDVATLAYGYGIAVSTLQLAHGYQVLADHGLRMPISFLKCQHPPTGVQVLSPAVADEIVKMLESVVSKGGTGWRARVPGYRVAGKTGTAYIAGPNGYNKEKFIASFVGLAPVTDPQLVVAVVIRDPQGQHFGGIVAAPVFSKVTAGALRILNIPPDALN